MPLISASGLTRHCRYGKDVLDKAKPKHPAAVAAAAEGTRFGKLVEDWLNGAPQDEPECPDEPWHWYTNLRAAWSPPPGVECEAPLGLNHRGEYVSVMEPEPHVYVAHSGEKLVTAGRADLPWVQGDVAVVADLKRSAWRYGYPGDHPQLMALGLAWASKQQKGLLLLGLFDARDSAWEWSDVIDMETEGPRMLAAVREMATMDSDPHPGPWCGGCFWRRDCKSAAKEES